MDTLTERETEREDVPRRQDESESAPNPLTHRFPFRHDVGNGGNGGGYE